MDVDSNSTNCKNETQEQVLSDQEEGTIKIDKDDKVVNEDDIRIAFKLEDSPGSKVQEETKPKPPNRWKQMYTTADWWTMWIGLISFFVGVAIVFIVPFELGSLRAKYVIPQPMKWSENPFDAWDLYNLIGTLCLFSFFLSLYLLSLFVRGKFISTNASVYVKGFFGIFVLATLAFWIGEQNWCKKNGFGYAIWSIIFGMILGNSPLTSGTRLSAVKTVSKDGEFFIKCSLVLLAVPFSILGELGLPAIVVAWVESPITLISSFFIGRKFFKMEIGPALLIATGATWCGASAISAIASVIESPNQDVVVSVGIVAAGTVIFTFLQPYFAILVGMDERVAGAWIGASVDQTGNVIASAAIISDEATEIAGIVKIVLNSALGLLATIVALWWQRRQQKLSENEEGEKKKGFSWLYLWDKFPKFVLGYLISSAVLTALVVEGTANSTALPLAAKSLSKWWFSIAFCGIGITTDLRSLYEKARTSGVIKLYIVANTIDILLAFLFAWLVF